MIDLPIIETSRCTGHCCEYFTLSSPIEHIRSWVDHPDSTPNLRKEYWNVADMVIQLPDEDDGTPRFTCRHFDTETRNCTNYENRPKLCREHGVNTACAQPSCTLR